MAWSPGLFSGEGGGPGQTCHLGVIDKQTLQNEQTRFRSPWPRAIGEHVRRSQKVNPFNAEKTNKSTFDELLKISADSKKIKRVESLVIQTKSS